MSEHTFPHDEFWANVLDNIEEYGVHITGVFATADDDDPGPPFAYTAGLTPHGHPELAMYGLPMQIAQALLNTLAAHIINDGMKFGHGDTIHRLVTGFPVRLVSIIDTNEDLTVTNTLYASTGLSVDALQVVYPDKNGLWPWEAGSGLDTLPVHGPVPDDTDGREITLPD